MRRIAPHTLWIGSRADLRTPRSIAEAGVTLLVDLAIEETIPSLSRELAFARFPLYDGAGNDRWLISTAITTCVAALGHGQTVLIICSAGLSRSPAIAAAVLAVRAQRPASECLAHVAAGHGDVSPSLWGSVQRALADIECDAVSPMRATCHREGEQGGLPRPISSIPPRLSL